MEKRTTLEDVSRAAGVSPITVSRALRNPAMVSQKVRERVAQAVRDLGYVPNTAARLLATGRSNVIGVVVPSVTNNVFSDVLRGIYSESDPTDYQVQVVNSRYSASIEEDVLRVFASQSPAGMIVAGFDQTAASRLLLESLDCPVVQIMETGTNPVDHCIGFSHFDGSQAATRHLIAQGYCRLGFVGARMDPRTQRRFDGFRFAASAAGLFDQRRVITTPDASSVACGARLFADLITTVPDVDAVFCNNDDLALGVMFEAQRRRIRIPQDLGICGFNDLEMMAAACPALTSVRTPRFEMGKKAISYVLARLAGTGGDNRQADLGFEVMARESTARGGPDR